MFISFVLELYCPSEGALLTLDVNPSLNYTTFRLRIALSFI